MTTTDNADSMNTSIALVALDASTRMLLGVAAKMAWAWFAKNYLMKKAPPDRTFVPTMLGGKVDRGWFTAKMGLGNRMPFSATCLALDVNVCSPTHGLVARGRTPVIGVVGTGKIEWVDVAWPTLLLECPGELRFQVTKAIVSEPWGECVHAGQDGDLFREQSFALIGNGGKFLLEHGPAPT